MAQQATRDDVQKDAGAVVEFLKPLLPHMGEMALADVVEHLNHAAVNEPALALLCHALSVREEVRGVRRA